MKAIEINGKIKTFSKLPKSWSFDGGTVLNFEKLSDEEAEKYGFYNVITPEYDSRIEKLGDLHLEGDVYTYDVLDIDFPLTLSKMKEQKIDDLNRVTFNKLQNIQWYWDRKERVGTEIPKEIIDKDLVIRANNEKIEAEINSLKTKKEVVLFDVNI